MEPETLNTILQVIEHKNEAFSLTKYNAVTFFGYGFLFGELVDKCKENLTGDNPKMSFEYIASCGGAGACVWALGHCLGNTLEYLL